MSAAGAEEALLVRVLTYNIHHGEGTDGRIDLERIAEVIRGAKPDVVALQECDRLTHRSGRVDQPAKLARLTGMHPVFGKNLDYDGGEYGNAVLTRWEVVQHQNHRLPRLENREQRGVLDVLLRSGHRDVTIRILATHLDHSRDDAERLACCERLAQLASEASDAPIVLAGDLNDEPKSAVGERLEQVWTFPPGGPVPTVPTINPSRQIDYVLYRPSAKWRVAEQRVLEGPRASDHLPLLVALEIREQSSGAVSK